METVASRISGYDGLRVPGLLQTPGYARAQAEADPSLHDDVARDSAAEAVLALGGDLEQAGATLHRVIGEAALHQQVGSAKVMQKQLAMLAQAADDSGAITVHCRSPRECCRRPSSRSGVALTTSAATASAGRSHEIKAASLRGAADPGSAPGSALGGPFGARRAIAGFVEQAHSPNAGCICTEAALCRCPRNEEPEE